MSDRPRPVRRTRTEARRRALRRVFPDASERPRYLAARLLRAGEVAAVLQVSRRSVAAWASRGVLPYIETPGGHRRFRAADVRALIAALDRTATPAEAVPPYRSHVARKPSASEEPS